MIGLSNPKVRNRLARLSRLSYIVVAFAVAFVGLTLAGVGFGFVFNFTHSAPFGLYKEISDPAKAPHTPAPYVFFCPDVRWPGMKGEPNYRKPMRTCPDGFAPLIKPVVAWPGDTVETSAQGVTVNGQLLAHTLTIDHDSTGHPIRPYAYGTYHVQPGQLWVVSSFSPKSFDSRYFGPIPARSVRHWVQPFLVEKQYDPETSTNRRNLGDSYRMESTNGENHAIHRTITSEDDNPSSLHSDFSKPPNGATFRRRLRLGRRRLERQAVSQLPSPAISIRVPAVTATNGCIQLCGLLCGGHVERHSRFRELLRHRGKPCPSRCSSGPLF